jgi:hypothetical protein
MRNGGTRVVSRSSNQCVPGPQTSLPVVISAARSWRACGVSDSHFPPGNGSIPISVDGCRPAAHAMRICFMACGTLESAYDFVFSNPCRMILGASTRLE